MTCAIVSRVLEPVRGMGLPILGKLLGHSQASTTQRYAHLASDPMRAAAEAIGAEIKKALERVDIFEKRHPT